MSQEYESMGRGELIARLEDRARVAADMSARIGALEAEREQLQNLVYVLWSDVLLPDKEQEQLLDATLRAVNPDDEASPDLGIGVLMSNAHREVADG